MQSLLKCGFRNGRPRHCLAALVCVVWASAISAQEPQREAQVARIGDIGIQLSDQDIASLAKLLPGGEKPWIVSGESGQIGGVQYVDAFSRPTMASTTVRRGSVVNLRRGIRPAPTEWAIPKAAENYAQVIVEGRSFDEIQGIQDINRPFRITGRFEDEELVSMVKVLRSAWNTGELRVPLVPLETAERRGNVAFVRLRSGHMAWYNVTLRQQGISWVIIEVLRGVA